MTNNETSTNDNNSSPSLARERSARPGFSKATSTDSNAAKSVVWDGEYHERDSTTAIVAHSLIQAEAQLDEQIAKVSLHMQDDDETMSTEATEETSKPTTRELPEASFSMMGPQDFDYHNECFMSDVSINFDSMQRDMIAAEEQFAAEQASAKSEQDVLALGVAAAPSSAGFVRTTVERIERESRRRLELEQEVPPLKCSSSDKGSANNALIADSEKPASQKQLNPSIPIVEEADEEEEDSTITEADEDEQEAAVLEETKQEILSPIDDDDHIPGSTIDATAATTTTTATTITEKSASSDGIKAEGAVVQLSSNATMLPPQPRSAKTKKSSSHSSHNKSSSHKKSHRVYESGGLIAYLAKRRRQIRDQKKAARSAATASGAPTKWYPGWEKDHQEYRQQQRAAGKTSSKR